MDHFKDCIICFKVFIPELEFQRDLTPDIPFSVSTVCRILQVPELTSIFTHICQKSSICYACQSKLIDTSKLLDELEILTAKVYTARADLEIDLVQAGKIGQTFMPSSGSGIARRRILDELRRVGAVNGLEIQSITSIKPIEIQNETPEEDVECLDDVQEPAIPLPIKNEPLEPEVSVPEPEVPITSPEVPVPEPANQVEIPYSELNELVNPFIFNEVKILVEPLPIDTLCSNMNLNAHKITGYIERDLLRVGELSKTHKFSLTPFSVAKKSTHPGFRCRFNGCTFRTKTMKGLKIHKTIAGHSGIKIEQKSDPENDQITSPSNIGTRKREKIHNSDKIRSIKHGRIGKRRSNVWTFFKSNGNDSAAPMIICKLCGVKKRAPNGSTGIMRWHLKSKHPDEFENPAANQSQDSQDLSSDPIHTQMISPGSSTQFTAQPMANPGKIGLTLKRKQSFHKCTFCGVVYNRKSNLDLHQKAFSAEGPFAAGSFTCPHCKAQFPGKSCIRIHMEKDHPAVGTIPCASCPKTFENAWELRIHRMQRHKGIKKPLTPHSSAPSTHKYPCKICSEPFETMRKLLDHRKDCKKTSKEAPKRIRRRIVPSNFKCEDCGKGFAKEGFLSVHRKTPEGVANLKNCSECFKSFPNELCLNHHMKTTHAEVYKANKSTLICIHCEKAYHRRDMFRLHQNYFSEAGPFVKGSFPCSHCSKIFPGTSCLNAHIEATHPEVARYACSQCGQRFQAIFSLNQHQNKAHGTKTPKTEQSPAPHLPESPQEPPIRPNLKNEGTSEAAEFPCTTSGCGKVFSTAASLKGHAARAGHGLNKSKTRQFCDFCSKSFPNQTTLNVHLNFHTKEVEFKCERGCGKVFYGKVNCKNHERICKGAKQVQDKGLNGLQGQGGVKDQTDGDSYSCGICRDITFPNLESLQKHLSSHF